MATVRLTNSIRDSIKKDLIKHRFAKDATAIMAAFSALAHDIYRDVYSDKDRRTMDSLPDGRMQTTDHVSVTLGGDYTNIKMSGLIMGRLCQAGGEEAEARRVRIPYKDTHRTLKVYEHDHPFTRRYQDLEAQRSELEQEVTAAQHKVDAALSSATTLKRLIDSWPEVEPFAKRHATLPPQLPAVRTEVLNDALGLPAEDA